MTTDSYDTYHCSFCGKIATEVEHIIAGPGVYICNECVGLCDLILAKKPTPPFPRSTTRVTTNSSSTWPVSQGRAIRLKRQSWIAFRGCGVGA